MIRISRIGYRVAQFFRIVCAPILPVDDAYAAGHLSSSLMACFRRMSSAERQHGITVCRSLASQGYRDPDLLTAALLHDVGKIVRPPRLWERVIVVLVEHAAPTKAAQWGESDPTGWKRAFVIRRMHPTWGAKLAAEAGASSRTVALIQRHHSTDEGDPLLTALQAADDT